MKLLCSTIAWMVLFFSSLPLCRMRSYWQYKSKNVERRVIDMDFFFQGRTGIFSKIFDGDARIASIQQGG